jgi:hypothetical protein
MKPLPLTERLKNAAARLVVKQDAPVLPARFTAMIETWPSASVFSSRLKVDIPESQWLAALASEDAGRAIQLDQMGIKATHPWLVENRRDISRFSRDALELFLGKAEDPAIRRQVFDHWVETRPAPVPVTPPSNSLKTTRDGLALMAFLQEARTEEELGHIFETFKGKGWVPSGFASVFDGHLSFRSKAGPAPLLDAAIRVMGAEWTGRVLSSYAETKEDVALLLERNITIPFALDWVQRAAVFSYNRLDAPGMLALLPEAMLDRQFQSSIQVDQTFKTLLKSVEDTKRRVGARHTREYLGKISGGQWKGEAEDELVYLEGLATGLSRFIADSDTRTQAAPRPWKEKDDAGQTALHRAVLKGKVEEVQLLLCMGADANATDNQGLTPLGLAEVAQRLAKIQGNAVLPIRPVLKDLLETAMMAAPAVAKTPSSP